MALQRGAKQATVVGFAMLAAASIGRWWARLKRLIQALTQRPRMQHHEHDKRLVRSFRLRSSVEQ